MLVSTPKKKKHMDFPQIPVIGSQDRFLLMLKRVYPSLRARADNDSDDEDNKSREIRTKRQRLSPSHSNQIDENASSKPQKSHNRKNIEWSEGRGLIAVGINECTRLLGDFFCFFSGLIQIRHKLCFPFRNQRKKW
jgi:hypothetical protein